MDYSAEIEAALNRLDNYANLMITTSARLRWMLQEQKRKNQASPRIELPSDEPEPNVGPSRKKRRLKKLQEYENQQKKEETRSATGSAEHVQSTHTVVRDPRVASLVQQQAPQLTQLLQPLQVRVPPPWPMESEGFTLPFTALSLENPQINNQDIGEMARYLKCLEVLNIFDLEIGGSVSNLARFENLKIVSLTRIPSMEEVHYICRNCKSLRSIKLNATVETGPDILFRFMTCCRLQCKLRNKDGVCIKKEGLRRI